MRCVLALVVLSGCGRFNFDATSSADASSDGPADGANIALSIIAPPDASEVGPEAVLTGQCNPGTVTITGDVATTSATCAGNQFTAELSFASGFGAKSVTIAQDGDSVTRTFNRVPQVPTPVSSRSGMRISQGAATNCNLVIDRPELEDTNLILGMIYSDGGSDGQIQTPGFTRLQLEGASFVAFYKFFEPTDPTIFEFPVIAGTGQTDTCSSAGVLVGIKDVDLVTPIMAQSSVAASLIAPSVTTTLGTRLVGVFGSNGPSSGIEAPPGMDHNTAAMPNGSFAVAADGFANALIAFQLVGVGATDTRTATVVGDVAMAAGLIALNPR